MILCLRRPAKALTAATLLLALAACTFPHSTPSSTGDTTIASQEPHPTDQLSPVACASLRQPIYESVNPTTGTALLTTSKKEIDNANKYGFSDYRGEVMRAASATNIAGLVAIHRMRASNAFAWVVEDRLSSMKTHGFTDQGVNFYASPKQTDCTKPVTELTRDNLRRYVTTTGEREQLINQGWVDRGSAFYVASDPVKYSSPTTVDSIALADPNPADRTFSFAAIPDTQIEVHSADDQRLRSRSQWLVDNRARHDLRFAVQIGDLVDWDTTDHIQYQLAKKGLEPMTKAHFPYFLNIGNHDGQAVCDGGGACDPRFTKELARMTDVFNQFFEPDQLGVKVGQFEPGKIDNTYTTIEAGGLKWLILNLELWPRESVVKWAGQLIREHPDYNAILSTHAFLNADNAIDNAPNYGGTTSQQLYDQIVAPYRNVKVILCGHVGHGGSTKVLRRKDGTKVFAFMQAYHSPTTNPVRLIEVDTQEDKITSWVTAPATSEEVQAPQTFDNAGFIR